MQITKLKKNEIFVFGSNANGAHAGGAALTAFKKFGAELGVGEGPTGKCYAIPTLDKNLQKENMTAAYSAYSAYSAAHSARKEIVAKIETWMQKRISVLEEIL